MTNDRQKRTSIILAMVALAIAAITICAVMFSMSSGQTKDPSSGVVLDKNAVAFDTGDTLSADPLHIRFPGYNDITLSQSDRDIPIVLTNPTGNPCLFQFNVTLDNSTNSLLTSGLGGTGEGTGRHLLAQHLISGRPRPPCGHQYPLPGRRRVHERRQRNSGTACGLNAPSPCSLSGFMDTI